jgi:CRISP-associated protein Cas1
MLLGRLGLETARLPHADRHGLISLDRGHLTVEDGCLTFACAGGGSTPAGRYGVPHQSVSLILLGPGSMVSHDALRLLARHSVGLAAVGDDGVRFYTAAPLLPDFSHLARAQAGFWADQRKGRLMVARRMYALRLGEVLPHRDIAVLRGIEGSRMKETYRIAAQRAGIRWNGRRYDRQNPNTTDQPNQALNHAASAVEGAAAIAVAATATIPQLGFIHEDSGQSFVRSNTRYGNHPLRFQGSSNRRAEAGGAHRTVDPTADRRTHAPRRGHSPSHRSHQNHFICAVIRRGSCTGGLEASRSIQKRLTTKKQRGAIDANDCDRDARRSDANARLPFVGCPRASAGALHGRTYDQRCSGARVVGGLRLARSYRGRFDSNGVARRHRAGWPRSRHPRNTATEASQS